MATTKLFTSKENYNKELDVVYNFHKKVFNTILAYLKKHGDRIITEKDNHPERWKFCFLDVDGNYEVNAVRLTEDGNGFYLDTTDEDGNAYQAYWDSINLDMCIEEMLMGLVFGK